MDAFSRKGVDVGWWPTTPSRMGPSVSVSMGCIDQSVVLFIGTMSMSVYTGIAIHIISKSVYR